MGFSAASYNSMEPEQTTPEDRERQRQILDATIDSILPRDENSKASFVRFRLILKVKIILVKMHTA